MSDRLSNNTVVSRNQRHLPIETPQTGVPDLGSRLPNFGREPSLSLGHTTVRSHDLATQPEIIVVHNYVMGPREHGGEPVAVLPWPDVDATASMRLNAVVRPGETAFTLPLQPGLKEYYQEVGILSGQEKFIEAPYQATTQEAPGFPYTDPLSLALKGGLKLEGKPYFVATFPSNYARQQMRELGGEPIQLSDAGLTNNKAVFRENADQYGFKVAPGNVIRSGEDLLNAAAAMRDASKVWVKLDRASGGDLVIPVDGPITIGKISAAAERLRAYCDLAFSCSDFGADAAAKYWHPSQPVPSQGALVVEQDLGDLGNVSINASNIVVINRDGSFEILEYAQQAVTSEGTFLGGSPWVPGQKLQTKLYDEMAKVVNYCVEERQLFGIVSFDFMLVDQEVYFIEQNGRISSNGIAGIIAGKLDAPHWINTKMTAPVEINYMSAFESAVTVQGVNLARSEVGTNGLIVPQALRALYNFDHVTKQKTLAHPSKIAETLVCGRDQDHCQQIMKALEEEKGIKFG